MSQKLSFEQLRRGASMDLASCLQMENRMVRRSCGLERCCSSCTQYNRAANLARAPQTCPLTCKGRPTCCQALTDRSLPR
jgi:hypothetical protein